MTACAIRTYCQQHWKFWLCCALAFIALFLLRTLNTTHVEIYDSFYKWAYATKIVDGEPEIIKSAVSSHHSMRWGINLPAALAQWVFGYSLKLYFSIPILTFTLFFLIFLIKSAKELALPFVILLGALLYVDPLMVRVSTQMQTRIFGSFYILLCILSLELKNKPLGAILSAVFLVFAYGAKETYGLFFGPPIGLFVLLKRPWKDTALFCLTLLVLLAIETIIMNQIIDDVSWGRFQGLYEGQHRTNQMLERMRLFSMWEMITYPWNHYTIPHMFIAAFGFFNAFIRLVVPRLRKALTQFQLLIYSCTVCFFLGTIFAFIQLNPFIPLQPPKTSYYAVVLPFLFYSNMQLGQTLLHHLNHRLFNDAPHWIKRAHRGLIFTAALLLILFAFQKSVFPLRPDIEQPFNKVPYGTAYWHMDDYLEKASDYILQDYLLIQDPKGQHRKFSALVLSLRHSNPILMDKTKYWHTATNGVKLFGRNNIRPENRIHCITLTKDWRTLHIPTEKHTIFCPPRIQTESSPQQQDK